MKKEIKSLSLNKQTIAILNKNEMLKIKGGKTMILCRSTRSPYLCIPRDCQPEDEK